MDKPDTELTTAFATVKGLLATDAVAPDVRIAFEQLLQLSNALQRPITCLVTLEPDSVPVYPLDTFAEDVRQLLVKAEKANHTTDEIGETVDAVLAGKWDEPLTPAPMKGFSPSGGDPEGTAT